MGIRVIQLDAQGLPTQPSAPLKKSSHFEHCPFCFTHANVAAFLSTGAFWPMPAMGRHELPQRFLDAPRSVFVWRSAQARGPPVDSPKVS
jgi:hypothetical protein